MVVTAHGSGGGDAASPDSGRRRRAAAAAGTTLAGVLAHLWLQAGMMLGWAGFNTSYFRNYYWGDQLAYLGIAAGVAHGESPDVEPYTLTGSIYYPRAYYALLGHLARLTSTHPATMWLVVGLLVQALLVAVIGATTVMLTRRWWSAIIAFTPFLLGTGSWMVSPDRWQTRLDSHAVLWGPFGVMYTLNGETVALSLGSVALLGLVLIATGRIQGRAAWVLALVAFLMVGALANVQTYGFLTVAYVLLGVIAAVGLVRSRSRRGLAATVGLVAALFLVGPAIASSFSPLATLALGLLPTLPGAWLLLREVGVRGWWCVAALVLGASPQVVATALGVVERDDFLVYRESSSTNLGVPASAGLFAAAAVVPALAFLVVLGLRHRRVLWVAAPLGLVSVWLLLASNDLWGANQEPYRLWLDVYVVIGVIVVPLAAWACLDVLALGRRATGTGSASGADGPVDVATRHARSTQADTMVPEMAAPVAPHQPGRAWRRWSTEQRTVALAAAGCVAVAGIWSAGDFVAFRRSVDAAAYLAITSPGYQAAAELGDLTDGGIVLTDACIDPVILKPVWGGAVAYYSPGLAWPANKADLDIATSARPAPETFDQEAALRSGIRWLMVNRDCDLDLVAAADAELVGTRSFSDDGGTTVQTLELWRLDG